MNVELSQTVTQEGEDIYGDFEDVETGQVVKGSELLAKAGAGKSGDAVTAAAQRAIFEATREENRLKKAALKAAFDSSVGKSGSRSGSGSKVFYITVRLSW